MRLPRLTSPVVAVLAAVLAMLPAVARASEADLVLPNLASVRFVGVDGWTLLTVLGLAVCALGLAFGIVQFVRQALLQERLPVAVPLRPTPLIGGLCGWRLRLEPRQIPEALPF